MHDGIYEELKIIDDQLKAAVREREEYNGKHQEAVMALSRLMDAFKSHYWDSMESHKDIILLHIQAEYDRVVYGVSGKQQ